MGHDMAAAIDNVTTPDGFACPKATSRELRLASNGSRHLYSDELLFQSAEPDLSASSGASFRYYFGALFGGLVGTALMLPCVYMTYKRCKGQYHARAARRMQANMGAVPRERQAVNRSIARGEAPRPGDVAAATDVELQLQLQLEVAPGAPLGDEVFSSPPLTSPRQPVAPVADAALPPHARRDAALVQGGKHAAVPYGV